MTRIFFVKNDVCLDPGYLDKLIKLMPLHMQLRAMNYHSWQNRQAYVLGKLMLLKALGLFKYSLNLDKIKYTVYNRPYVDCNIDFSVSHSGAYITCIISDECIVGIDIEEIRAINIHDFSGQFTFEDWNNILQGCRTGKYDMFYEFWTKKEAAVKADGRGLTVPLEKVIVCDDYAIINERPWFLAKHQFAENYTACTASAKRVELSAPIEEFVFTNRT